MAWDSLEQSISLLPIYSFGNTVILYKLVLIIADRISVSRNYFFFSLFSVTIAAVLMIGLEHQFLFYSFVSTFQAVSILLMSVFGFTLQSKSKSNRSDPDSELQIRVGVHGVSDRVSVDRLRLFLRLDFVWRQVRDFEACGKSDDHFWLCLLYTSKVEFSIKFILI